MRKSKGYRRGTRRLLRKHPRKRGLVPLGRFLREYKKGQKVTIIIDPSMHKGQPHRRFHGKIGSIEDRRGRAYIVSITDGNKKKTLIIRPEHIHQHMGG